MKMIIDGKKADAANGEVMQIICPATNKLLDTVPNATESDVDAAVAAAIRGQKEWAAYPAYRRAEILYTFLDLAEAEKEHLAHTLCLETGKPISEARREVGNIQVAFRSFIEHGKHLLGQTIPPGLEAGYDNHLQIIIREPLGVVVAIIPFNVPCNLFCQKVAPSLMAGNAVIVKPPHQNPLTVCMMVEMLVEAGVPAGAIQAVTGWGPQAGQWLTHHPGVDAITFTGSTAVGHEAAAAAAEHLTHITLELGGNDPFIVCEDADLDLTVEEIVNGRMFNTGQICCASKRFIVQNSVKEEFTRRAVDRLQQLKLGPIDDPETQLGCLISEEAAKRVEEQVNKTVAQGGKIVLGGIRKGAFYQPTVIADVPRTADIALDMEVFGPVVPIIGFDTIEEAVEIANASKYGLSGGVFSRDFKKAYKIVSQLDSGSVVINGSGFLRSFEMPFGGNKQSGIGREGALSTFDEVTKSKVILMKNLLA